MWEALNPNGKGAHGLLCGRASQKRCDTKGNRVLLEAGATAGLGRCPRRGPAFCDHAAKEFAMQCTQQQDYASKVLGAFRKKKKK